MATAKRTCSFDGCERPLAARGWCASHYRQWRQGVQMRDITPPARTAENFDESYAVKPNGCWIWAHPLNHGYGYLSVNGRRTRAHRHAYEKHVAPLHATTILDHMCRNKACVNPEHLQVATRKTNAENMGPSKVNSSGVRGVHWDPVNSKWSAQVKHHYKSHWVGRFDTLAQAEAAVIAKRNELYTNNLADHAAAS